MRVFIEKDIFFNEIVYTFKLFASNKGIKYSLTEKPDEAELVISTDENADIRISRQFHLNLKEKKFDHKYYFDKEPLFYDPAGFVDYLSTAFYMVNVIQEKDNNDLDEFNRYKYNNSYQKKFNVVRRNLVQEIFDKLFIETPKLKSLKGESQKTRIFLSHDIDTVNGSIIQDTFFSVKKLRPDLVLKVILQNVISKPHWLNIDRIMKIESEYDFVSTFFWLVNKGKTPYGLNNSDYNIKNRSIIKVINTVEKSKWENGIHKSASDESFAEEISKLPFTVNGNRFHYIRFQPHKHFKEIEKAGLSFDSTLGYADAPGFRNNYALPYCPYDFEEGRAFRFVECPLNIMDTTYFNYLKQTSTEFVKDVIDLTEKNKMDSVLSVLIHNNFVSDYKYGKFNKSFRDLLSYFYESGFKCISKAEIINLYRHEN